MRIGVLALQGAFIEHEQMLARVGADSFEIRQLPHLDGDMDGLIIPGGESTVQGKLMRELGLTERLKEMIVRGLPVWGTCAGLILLAERIVGQDDVYLGTMNITARRNAYGRQLGSFETRARFEGAGDVPMTFIRAPYIESAGAGAKILATVDGKAVAARQGNQLVTAFHPELTDDLSLHAYFTEMVRGR